MGDKDPYRYFRIEARHMAVYPAKGGITHATATWIDGGKTLRVEATTPVEVSQGIVPIRLYSEYRVSELGDTLTVIELRSSRNRPLVYVFKKVPAEAAKMRSGSFVVPPIAMASRPLSSTGPTASAGPRWSKVVGSRRWSSSSS